MGFECQGKASEPDLGGSAKFTLLGDCNPKQSLDVMGFNSGFFPVRNQAELGLFLFLFLCALHFLSNSDKALLPLQFLHLELGNKYYKCSFLGKLKSLALKKVQNTRPPDR